MRTPTPRDWYAARTRHAARLRPEATGGMQRMLAALRAHWWGPPLLAIVLGLLSVPLVAGSLAPEPPEWQAELIGVGPLDSGDAFLLATVSVIAAALVGGGLASRLVRRNPVAASLVAIGTAWPTAIAMLSVTAAVFGIGLATPIVCIDSCNPEITNTDPSSGLRAYVATASLGVMFVVPIVLSIVCILVAVVLRRQGTVLFGSLFIVVGYGALHFWSVRYGAVPFACLAIGVVVWAVTLGRHEPAPVRPGGVT